MAIEKKERYIVDMEVEDGDKKIIVRKTVVASSYQEVIQLFGEENIQMIEKRDYVEVTE